jgi:hypothetical protein
MKNKSPGKRRTLWIAVLIITVVLVGFRLMLPSIVLRVVNQKLTKIDGYKGSVSGVDVFLIAGSYTIKDIKLEKTGGGIAVPFFTAKAMDLSVEWTALFKGEVVGEIEVKDPVLNYVKGPTEATTQTSINNDWIQVVNDLVPLRINRFEVTGGSICYHDFHSTPRVEVVLDDVHILATNLINADDKGTLLPATVYGSGKLYEGSITLNIRLNPFNETPVFDMNAEISTTSLKNLNDLFKAYSRINVQKGTFSLYTEAAARENKIVGYAKPILKDMDVLPLNEGAALNRIRQDTAGIVAWVFRDQPGNQSAAQIKFEGNIKQPHASNWSMIGETLQSAFLKALIAPVENSIAARLTGNGRKRNKDSAAVASKGETKEEKKKNSFIKRLFGKKDDKERKKEGSNKKDEDDKDKKEHRR